MTTALLVLLALSGCRAEGEYAICANREPPPCHPAEVAPIGDSDTGLASCPGPTDADGDAWHAADEGGRDCDDGDATIGACPDGDTGADGDTAADAPCVPAGDEVCNGVDDDCDGVVDDSLAVRVEAEPGAMVAGGLLAGGAPALALGVEGDDGHGAVDVYDADGALVVRIAGTGQSTSFGSQLATGRDLTGDGLPDLVIAAPYAETGDGPNSGRVFVLAGPISPSTMLGDAVGWFEGGELDGQPGGQLALGPDLTGDGLAELVIGHYRHTLIFSGMPTPGARIADAVAVLEMNTGGGAWHYAFADDEDGDDRPELLLGMPTWDGGTGVVATLRSSDLGTIASLTSHPDWPGLGSKLVRVGEDVWTLSGTTPVRLRDFAALAQEATGMVNGGDLDGDGAEDLLLETAAGVLALRGDGGEIGLAPLLATLQSNRDAQAPGDLDGDAIADPLVLLDSAAGALSGSTAFTAPCDGDGDGLSAAAGDCDDDDDDVFMGAPEACNGRDDDCDGVVDTPVDLELPAVSDRSVIAGFVATEGDAANAGDGWLLDGDGIAWGVGTWEGLALTGLSPRGPGNGAAPALVLGGDLEGTGVAYLLAHAEAADLVVSTDVAGDALTVAHARIHDGTGLTRDGTLAAVGDVDGDGSVEAAVGYADPVGHVTLALFSAPIAGDPTADEADWHLALPDGWVRWTLGQPASPAGADMDGDGLADLVAGGPDAYYGQGRVSVVVRPPAGLWDSDAVGLLHLYGEPDEGLGSAIALGDLDGDGVDDAALADTTGVRVLRGAACPVLEDRLTTPASWVALYDGNGDGTGEVWTASALTGLAADGAFVRDATLLLGAHPGGLLYADDARVRVLRPSCNE